MKFRQNTVGHHMPTPKNPKTFVVSARRGMVCRQFIVIAETDGDAIERLRENTFALVHVIVEQEAVSSLEMLTKRPLELIAHDTTYEAVELDPTRCFAVSYFDDERSYA